MTLQYFIKYTDLKTEETGLYTNANDDAITCNFIDMALAFAKELSLDYRNTRYTVIRYRNGIHEGDCGYYESGFYYGAGDTMPV